MEQLNVILFDAKDTWTDLLPISYTRPLADVRFGILTIREKWEKHIPQASFSYLTKDYLRVKFPMNEAADNLFIAGNICPDPQLTAALLALKPGEALATDNCLLGYRGTFTDFENQNFAQKLNYEGETFGIHQLYDIFLYNDCAMAADYPLVVAGRESQPLSKTCTVVGPTHFDDGTPTIFIEEGAWVEAATFNTTNGPIYIGKESTVMEGSCIRAPFAAAEHCYVNMGSKIYGATTLGPYCKVGGELNNVVMMGYSNKAHDGFLGNAVIGEWCNLGAGTNASNLKNDYTEIKLWNYRAHRFVKTGLQFCGLIMGDHSKAGINCMSNTATVIGVGVNVHGAGFPRNFVASFSEGSVAGYTDVSMTKFFDIAKRVMARRNIELSEVDKEIFYSIYNIADNYK